MPAKSQHSITFSLCASVLTFADWFGQYVLENAHLLQDIGGTPMSIQGPVQSGRGVGKALRLELLGSYFRPTATAGEMEGVDVPNLASFTVVGTGTGWLAVTAECHRSDLLPYYCELLKRIGDSFPESSPSISAYLQPGDKPAVGAGEASASKRADEPPRPGPTGGELTLTVCAVEGRKRSYRKGDHDRRIAIWHAIAPTWNKSQSYTRCRELLRDKHPNLLRKSRKSILATPDTKTLRLIIEDGQAGLLS